jgi:hypothetical protein
MPTFAVYQQGYKCTFLFKYHKINKEILRRDYHRDMEILYIWLFFEERGKRDKESGRRGDKETRRKGERGRKWRLCQLAWLIFMNY